MDGLLYEMKNLVLHCNWIMSMFNFFVVVVVVFTYFAMDTLKRDVTQSASAVYS